MVVWWWFTEFTVAESKNITYKQTKVTTAKVHIFTSVHSGKLTGDFTPEDECLAELNVLLSGLNSRFFQDI